LYPATALVEGTNVSVGRGTEHPFEVVGAPWVDAESLLARCSNPYEPALRWRSACAAATGKSTCLYP
jgi:uncharacterized protein YbbC (DUF1343 family)